MTSDDSKRRPDVRFKPVGAGLSQTFRCAQCDRHRLVPGRRLQRVHGVKQWVCKDCST